MEKVKDHLGNTPEIGDVIVYSEYKSSRLYVGTIVDFNKSGIPIVEQHGYRGRFSMEHTSRKTAPSRFVITNIDL